MVHLCQILEALAEGCSPTRDDYDRRKQLIDDVQTALQHRLSLVEDLRVIPYGSFVSGFYNATSDLDLAICGKYPTHRLKPSARAEIFQGLPEESHVPLHKLDKRTKQGLLRDAGSALLQAGVAARGGMEWVLHARVPIIKFAARRCGLEVDLCLGSEAVGFKAWSVGQVAAVHPAFGKLFRVVKLWAKAHSINDGASHMFNSWCLTLVVMFFLQHHAQPPLLPPLHELLYDSRPEEATPRVMQGGEELSREVYDVMATRAAHARALYSVQPCPPLDQLFRDFVAACGGMLRGLLTSGPQAAVRSTRVSPFYGALLPGRPFASSYVLLVEDPYNSDDNTARTFGTWEGHAGTIQFVASVFERTADLLDSHLGTPAAGPSASAPGLAPTLAFLFGPELLCRLPAGGLCGQALGQEVEGWARAAVAAGRPAGEVHREMLRWLGFEGEFLTFDAFKRAHKIHVNNESKYATLEEKAAREAAEAARKAAKKARDAEKRAKKRHQDAVAAAARAAAGGGDSGDAPAEAGPSAAAAVAAAGAAAAAARAAGRPPPPPKGPRKVVAAEALTALRTRLAEGGQAAASASRRSSDGGGTAATAAAAAAAAHALVDPTAAGPSRRRNGAASRAEATPNVADSLQQGGGSGGGDQAPPPPPHSRSQARQPRNRRPSHDQRHDAHQVVGSVDRAGEGGGGGGGGGAPPGGLDAVQAAMQGLGTSGRREAARRQRRGMDDAGAADGGAGGSGDGGGGGPSAPYSIAGGAASAGAHGAAPLPRRQRSKAPPPPQPPQSQPPAGEGGAAAAAPSRRNSGAKAPRQRRQDAPAEARDLLLD